MEPGRKGRVLVTGAAGFIGRAFCSRLLEAGWKVRALARGSIVPDMEDIEFSKRSSLESVSSNDADFDAVDAIVHLAGCAHARGMSAREREITFSSDAHATAQFARAAAQAGVRRFVFVSTAKVLGEETGPNGAFTHGSLPAPADEYARYKLAAEDAVRDCADELGMEWVVVRPVLVYGEGVKGNLATLLNWINAGYPLPFGGQDNRRSLIALDDLNDLLVDCISSQGVAGQRLLASGDEAVSTSEICSCLAEGLNRPARIVRLPHAFWTAMRAIPFIAGKARRIAGSFLVDNSHTKELTGWRPRTSVQQGLIALGRSNRDGK